MKRLLVCGVAALLIGCTPERASRAPISAAVPAQYAGFVGRWTGIWDGMEANTATLIVENVSAQGEVTGTYQYQDSAPGRFRTAITGDAFRFGGSARFTFTLLPDGRLRGERVTQNVTNATVLTRR